MGHPAKRAHGEPKIVSIARRNFGGLINQLLALLLMIVLQIMLFPTFAQIIPEPSAPIIGFMSVYDEAQQLGWVTFSAIWCLSIIVYAAFGAIFRCSVGHAIVFLKWVDANGVRVSIQTVFNRSLVSMTCLLILVIPGPALGFLAGAYSFLGAPPANVLSMLLLIAGLCFVIWICAPRHDAASPRDRVAGIYATKWGER